MTISQDPIVGNQQKSSAFWERIYEHYDSFNPVVHRGARSLESKWGIIKHDALKFMGCYQQIKRLNKSGVGEVDIIRMAKDLYRTKSPKNAKFTYEHCWSIVKDYPRWADGVTTTRHITPTKRKSMSSEHESQAGTTESVGVVESPLKSNASLRDRPMGTKVAKETQRSNKIFENAANRQAMATEAIDDAQIRKVNVLEDQNMILLMQTINSSATPTAQEYFRLRQEEELEKLRKRLEEKAEKKRREREDIEAKNRMEATREREVAEAEARENMETMRQMRSIGGHIAGRHDFDAELEEFESDHDQHEENFEGAHFTYMRFAKSSEEFRCYIY